MGIRTLAIAIMGLLLQHPFMMTNQMIWQVANSSLGMPMLNVN